MRCSLSHRIWIVFLPAHWDNTPLYFLGSHIHGKCLSVKRCCSFISPVSQGHLETSSGIYQKYISRAEQYLPTSMWLKAKGWRYCNITSLWPMVVTYSNPFYFCKWEGSSEMFIFGSVRADSTRGGVSALHIHQEAEAQIFQSRWWAGLWATRSTFGIFMVLQKEAKQHIMLAVDVDPITIGKLKLLY